MIKGENMEKFLEESGYLIHLVRCAVHGLQPRELPEGLCFELVYECGIYHHVANIAFYSLEKLKNKPEPELYRKWQACRDMAIVLDINQSFAAREIRDALSGADIRWLEVQGTKIKPLYPQPEWRTMSDIDFIIDRENLPKAKALLQDLGYQCWDVHRVAVHGRRVPNINVEMHSVFFEETTAYYNIIPSPFDTVDQTGQCDLDTFYLYNLLHIAKHYFRGGCGIRRVLDVYYLNKHYGHLINRTAIRQALEHANAADFAAGLNSLALSWFGEGEEDLPQTDMAGYILNSGLHGNRYNEVKNRLDKTFDKTTRFAKVKFLIRRVFGAGGTLKNKYPVLERHKILYPFCWLHRTFRALRPKKLKRIRNEVRTVMKTKPNEE